MMRAGMSYSDWRLMAHFQRKDYLARRTIEMAEMAKKLEGADKPNEIIGLIVAKLMGF